jgi:hypothetical protein
MEGGMGREATDSELSGGVICDGLGSSFAALFGVLPNTSFSQNVGLVTITKIVNRSALATGAIFLILCGLFPKLAALISIMPQSVLGGAAVMMFSSIVVSGIQLVTKNPITARKYHHPLGSTRTRLWTRFQQQYPDSSAAGDPADLRRFRHRTGSYRGNRAQYRAATVGGRCGLRLKVFWRMNKIEKRFLQLNPK